MSKPKFVQVENRRTLLELLRDNRQFDKIIIANNVMKDGTTKSIMSEAKARQIPISRLSRQAMGRRSRSGAKPAIIGYMTMSNQMTLDELLDVLSKKDKFPNFLIFDDIHYNLNIAAIFRTAYACGVNGVITPIKKNNLLTDDVVRVSRGNCLRIPIIEMNIFDAMKKLQKDGIRVISLETGDKSIYEADLTGPTCIIVGDEEMGISKKILERSDDVVTIPMKGDLASLNVSVSAGVTLYEKLRQESVTLLG